MSRARRQDRQGPTQWVAGPERSGWPGLSAAKPRMARRGFEDSAPATPARNQRRLDRTLRVGADRFRLQPGGRDGPGNCLAQEVPPADGLLAGLPGEEGPAV